MKILRKIPRARFFVTRRFWRYATKLNNNVLAVQIEDYWIGFFAYMNRVIEVLQFAENYGFDPYVECISSNYQQTGMSRNWLSYFFNYEKEFKLSDIKILINTKNLWNLNLNPEEKNSLHVEMDLETANILFFRYFSLKPFMVSKIDKFCKENHINCRSLAVHYRGTDKTLEAPRVSYDTVIDLVRDKLREGNFKSVFVASDEAPFIDRMVSEFGRDIVKHYEIQRSNSTTPMHLDGSKLSGYDRGLSALVDCLTLARCGAIVRTASLLSSWASVFNPELKVTVASLPYEDRSWWPERLIARTAEIA